MFKKTKGPSKKSMAFTLDFFFQKIGGFPGWELPTCCWGMLGEEGNLKWRFLHPGRLTAGTWEYRPPWKMKVIWTKPSFSGSMLFFGVVMNFRWMVNIHQLEVSDPFRWGFWETKSVTKEFNHHPALCTKSSQQWRCPSLSVTPRKRLTWNLKISIYTPVN